MKSVGEIIQHKREIQLGSRPPLFHLGFIGDNRDSWLKARNGLQRVQHSTTVRGILITMAVFGVKT
ncbi:hypothetical protein T265_05471 [Opisthorchis viverrini]|uniref:Uncharacterized protein n=1 Tax=Opisthorchis viverrini TaxID=6198 RepID=A0A074ZKD8_OPIVI|nr:hypothetical protein T265_05471 [Opisthorchis viverrini]KER27511.1 hypothetical protein T265_05471 [Opisthorchis viverrini]